MKAKTREFLYHLLWACNVATRPTFRNLTDSFESWAYRNGFQRQLALLEKQRLLEARETPAGDRIHCLTEEGRRAALGSRDPVSKWTRRWDGKWRMVLFDVPQERAGDRARLQRSLSARGFGYLQNSVWITPDPLIEKHEALVSGPIDVESLILLEARPCAGESDAQIVAGAWDFDAINANYRRHLKILARLPRQSIAGREAARRLQRWLREEQLAWREAMKFDPLLPERLHPANYEGVKAWNTRQEVMTEVGRQIRNFRSVSG